MNKTYNIFRAKRVLFIALAILSALALAVPSSVWAQAPEPLVAIHVSELTQALETMAAVSPTPTGSGTTGYQWWNPSWHYFVAYESLKEALRSDGTPFVVVSDSDIAAGKLRNADGSPRYPILISLASEAIADNEIAPLRDYASAGGFLFVGSSAFTRNPNGTSRGNFALATEMGLHMASSNLQNWNVEQSFTKTSDHRLTGHIPYGTLAWFAPLTSEEIPWGISPSHVQHAGHYVWRVVANDATVIANGVSGPLMTVKNYGKGQFIYHAAFQPLIGHGGYDPGMYAYLIFRRAIEWAFESFNFPIIKVSPWPYQYDAAFVVRHDFEDNQTSIKSIEPSAQLEHSLGAKGDYYFSTGALRVNLGGDATTIAGLRSAVSNYDATIGSHNGGLKNPVNMSLSQYDYDYWHWGPDEALDTTPQGYANGKAYATASIQASFQDIAGWLTGLDNGRTGCGAAGNCPRTWVSPYFNSTREGSYDVLGQLGSITMGEQKVSPFPHWTMSYQTPGKRYTHITLPVSDWYIGGSIYQCLTYNSGVELFTVNDIRDAVDFYYGLGALINFYGHMPSNYGTIGKEYISYSMSKPRIWPTNAVGVNDWWRLRSNVVATPTVTVSGFTYAVSTPVSGATDPNTAVEIALPQVSGKTVGSMYIFLDGSTAASSEYRTTDTGVKIRVGSTVSTVLVQYTLNLSPPAAVDDAYNASANTAMIQAAPGILSNDTDPNGTSLTAQWVSGPSHGTLTLNSDGSFSYTPAANFVGTDSFTYTANNGSTSSNIATVSITVSFAGTIITPHEITVASSGGVCNAPAHIVSGNLLIASFLQGSKSGNPTLPSGWVLDRTQDFSSYAYRLCVVHKIAGGAEPGTYTFSGYGGSGVYDLSIVRLDGNNTSNPVDSGVIASSSVVSSSATFTFPTVTTANANDLLYYVGESTGTPSCTWPAGTSELYDPVDGHSAGYELQSTQGVSNARKITWSASSSERMGIVVAYKSSGVTANNPAPTTTSLSPASVTAGGSAFTLTINGTGFINGSVVQWNGASRTTTYVSSAQLTAAIAAADIATAGTASVTVFNPAPGGGTSNTLTFTVANNPVPSTTSLSPTSATTGGTGFTLAVNGANFMNGSVVQWKGSNRTTTYISSTQLTAAITAADIATAGTASVTVFNPAPGGGTSNTQTFTINAATNPVPATTSLSPSSTAAGGAAFTLTVNGNSFVNGSVVQWNGTSRTTTYVSATQLTAAIATADISTAGTASVTVFNPAPGGGTSNAQAFAINSTNNPVPATTGLSPASALAGGAAFTLTVNGTGFINGSVVQWNGTSRTTTYVSATQLTAAIATADISTAGTASVTVFNPAPGGGTSNTQTFAVNVANNPVPTTTGLSPTSATAGGAAFTLTVNGNSFVNGSVVQWKGSNRTTTYISATQLTAAITAADIATAGTATVTVFNSAPGGGTSNALTFTINVANNPVPTTTGLSPTSAVAGGAAFALTVNGTSFINGSVVQWNGTSRTTTYISSTQLTAAIAAVDIATAGTASVTVFNPAPGGGSSNAQTLMINAANTAIAPHEITSASNGGVCNAPANIVSGNLLIASFLQGSKSGNPTLPSGWVLDRTQDFSSNAYRLCVAHKIAGGAEPGTYIFSGYGGSGIYDLSIVRLDGNDISTPVDSGAMAGSSAVAGSATYTFPTVTTVYANDLLYYAGESTGTPSCTWPNGTLELYDPVDGHSAGYEMKSTSGLSTARNITWSASSTERMGIVVAYKSATAGTATNPVPATTSLSPSSTAAGGAAFTLTVNGNSFVNGSVVQWNGTSRTTTYVSATQLTAAIATADISTAGTASVTVFNPAPGGGTSNAQAFAINSTTNPVPATTGLSPTSALTGGAAFALTVNGTGFINGSVVQWNGTSRTTTYVSATQLTAAIATADISTAGTASVTVFNPAPGGGTSNAQTFAINSTSNPVPVTTGLSPTSALAGGPTFTITVNGNNFINGSVVQWNGSSRTTTFSSTTLSDDFNRSNINPLGGNWTTLPASNNLKILNNSIAGAVACVGTNSCDAYWNAVTFSDDQCSQVTLIRAGAGIYSGPIVRASHSSRSFYALNADVTAYQVYKVANGLETVLGANVAVAPSNNDILKICAIGNSITAYINGTLVATRTDSTITTGSPGIEVSYGDPSNPTLDNWSGWSVGAGSTTQLTASITAADIATAGTASVTVFNPAPGGGTSNAQTFTTNNPVPVTTILSPAIATAGGAGLTLTVNGSSFVNGSVVQWNGASRTTTYVSPTQLTAAITAADIAPAGTATVTVYTPAPGGGTSNAQTFTINAANNPVPATTGLSPASALAGGAAFTLTVNGRSFVNGSVVQWNGTSRTTTYLSETQLMAAITAADIAAAGTATVTVYTPAPGGGTSNAQTFTINVANNPVPATTGLSPTSALTGGAAFTLTVNGTGFINGSEVQWNGTSRTTTYVSPTQLTAAITAADIAAAGTATVTVFTPAPGGGTSNAQTFTINVANNPVPTTSSFSPAAATSGGAGFTLTVYGANFINGSVVQWNGSNRTTTLVSTTQLTAAITAADIMSAGTASVTVFNPTPGGGVSNAGIFTVNDPPVPTMSSLSPSSRTAGGAAFTLTVNGTGFAADSIVLWNGANRTTAYVSSTRLTAAITAPDIATAGSAQVMVFTPAPGGGTSNALTVTVNNPLPATTSINPTNTTAGGPSFTLTVRGSGFVAGSVVRWNGANRTTSYISASRLTAVIQASDIVTAGTSSVTVFNAAPGGGISTTRTFRIN